MPRDGRDTPTTAEEAAGSQSRPPRRRPPVASTPAAARTTGPRAVTGGGRKQAGRNWLAQSAATRPRTTRAPYDDLSGDTDAATSAQTAFQTRSCAAGVRGAP